MLAGRPLGDTLRSPVVMQNLLGDLWERGVPNWQPLFADPTATLHLYRKAEPRPGRKGGHDTFIAPTVDEALDAALRWRALVSTSAHTARPSQS